MDFSEVNILVNRLENMRKRIRLCIENSGQHLLQFFLVVFILFHTFISLTFNSLKTNTTEAT